MTNTDEYSLPSDHPCAWRVSKPFPLFTVLALASLVFFIFLLAFESTQQVNTIRVVLIISILVNGIMARIQEE